MRVALGVGSQVAVTGVLISGISQTILQDRAATVVHCQLVAEDCFAVGVRFLANGSSAPVDSTLPDYYDSLQLSQKADPETIHRVYRLLAQRYHPDNQETGDQTQFKSILEAYRVLSDPEQRAAYDTRLARTQQHRWRIFDQAEAAQGREGERRKRAGILGLLYTQRQNEPQQPALGIHEMEDLLGCPREHLEFPLWYLRESGYLSRTDNGRYTITVKGIDKSESEDGILIPADRLLTAGSRTA